MYEEYFGLNEKPFSIQPDPSFLYWGRSHRLAYAMLEYGVLNHAGISVVTGEVGCGKTTLIHRLLDQLSESHTVALLSNIQEGRGDLLSWVLMGFGQPFAGKSHVELFSQLQSFFIGEYAKGRRVVLIIDEAQNLSIDMLEELRMLSNINAGKDQLLQLILVGQPELKSILNRPDMLQLAQRVGSDFHLTPLSRDEVDAYLETRLAIAGARRRIFNDRAVDLIAEQSRGVPRVINIIADTALVYAFSAQENMVDAEIIRSVIRDKLDYGVFGLATSNETAAPTPPAGARNAFVASEESDETPVAREPKTKPRAEPKRTSGGGRKEKRVIADDEPRMPQPARPRAEPKPAAAKPAASAESLVGMLTRPEDAAPDPQPRPAKLATPPARNIEEVRPRPELIDDDEPAPAPQEDAFAFERSAAQITAASVGVVVVGSTPKSTIESAAGAGGVVYVAQSTDSGSAELARRAGAEVLEIADRALSPGRARNAGYRQIKKLNPDLRYVQFVESGLTLDPDWLETAANFMDRRPEVAAIDGRIGAGGQEDAGEIQVTGPTALVRADAFEAAGGFRGDLPVNETQDLCIRLRRRGAHIWRLEARMGDKDPARGASVGWWSRAVRRGFQYAHGADLHGGPPENLYEREQFAAVFWGAVMPFLIIAAAVGAAVAVNFLAPLASPVIAGGAVLAAGVVMYVVKIAAGAMMGRRSIVQSAGETLANFPEFLGAWRFYVGGARKARGGARGA